MTPANRDVGAFLVAQTLVTSTEVFYGGLPEGAPDECIAVSPLPGMKPGKKFGGAGIAYDHSGVEILVRGPREDYAAAESRAFAIYERLGRVEAQTIGSAFYHGMNLLSAPQPMGRDSNKRPILRIAMVPEREL